MLRTLFFIIGIAFFQTGCFNNSKPADAPGNNNGGTVATATPDNSAMPETAAKDSIPLKVYQVLQYIRLHHAPMPGFVGGTTFGNFQGVLPKSDAQGKTIVYQEWDVNKHVKGVNRGVERLVTGSDGRAWYTHDHYVTFAQVLDKKVPATDDVNGVTNSDNASTTVSNNYAAQIAKVIASINDNDAPPAGYQGGSVFENREKLLPETDAAGKAITYKVWDINPSTNRGIERIVTGSDERVWFTRDKFKSFSEVDENGAFVASSSNTNSNASSDDAAMPNASGTTTIPPKVYTVLKYVLKNHAAPPGYVGGREFTNFEKVLPYADATGKKIFYQEWDVNKHIQGVNRGAERLCTGADGRNWYTKDHYITFVQVK